jgi:hypothetical protein
MGRTCSMYKGDKKCIENFVRKLKGNATWEKIVDGKNRF